MNHVTPYAFVVKLCVETRHNFGLEEVLNTTFARKINTRSLPYVECLRNMLDKAFLTNVQIEVYGYVKLVIEANTFEQLNKEITRCNTVVGRWLNRFRIEEMKL